MLLPGAIELVFLLLVIALPVALLIALAVVISQNRRTAVPPLPPGTPSLGERTKALRQKQDRYREERSRILGMVDQGKIAAEEADRLFETLERETTTMDCPFCGGEIRVEAAKCRHCRRYLVEEMVRPKRLTKSRDKVLAGVCGGVADYFGLDRSLVRVLVALVVFFSAIVTGLIVYVVAALILPEAEEAGG